MKEKMAKQKRIVIPAKSCVLMSLTKSLPIVGTLLLLVGSVTVGYPARQHGSTQDQQLDAYGSKTRFYIGRLDDAITVVAKQTQKLSSRPELVSDREWKRTTSSQLSEIIRSGDKMAHIRPVPAFLLKLNARLAGYARDARDGARKYRRGMDNGDHKTMMAGYKEMVVVGLTFEKLTELNPKAK